MLNSDNLKIGLLGLVTVVAGLLVAKGALPADSFNHLSGVIIGIAGGAMLNGRKDPAS
jgi:hypothetical protein